VLGRAQYFAVCLLSEHNQAKILCVFPRLELEEGTLYPALQRMLRAGLLESKEGVSAKERPTREHDLTLNSYFGNSIVGFEFPSGRCEIEETVKAAGGGRRKILNRRVPRGRPPRARSGEGSRRSIVGNPRHVVCGRLGRRVGGAQV